MESQQSQRVESAESESRVFQQKVSSEQVRVRNTSIDLDSTDSLRLCHM